MPKKPPPKLPDVLAHNLKIVFCGTAASNESARVGAYYAGRGNAFWETLYQVGLTPTHLKPAQFRQVLKYDLGLTDLVKHNAGMDKALRQSDFDPDRLRKTILTYKPQILAFTSKRAGKEYLQQKRIPYGLQTQTIGKTQLFVLPSPSGAARGYWDIAWWQQLSEYVKK